MEEANIVVDVEASMQRELDKLWGNTNEPNSFTIFRTPDNISQNKKNLFKPSVISIGPFHRGQEHLRALEEQKWRFLQDFLSRGDHISLNLCLLEMKSLEERTRRCYSEIVDLKSSAFVEMMLLDGCFVLEYFMKILKKQTKSIFKVGWHTRFIVLDLLLLENQIPFFIVEKLYDIGFVEECKIPFFKFISSIFFYRGLSKDKIDPDEIPDPPAEIHHLVHLCYHYLVPNPEKPIVLSSKSFDLTTMFSTNRIKGLLTRRFPHSTSRSLSVSLPNSTGNISSMAIPPATELKQKGVKFTPKTNLKHMLDISFEYGVLKIPRLTITDDTKIIFTNLLAFEQSQYPNENKPFMSFVTFLDNLVNTQNDVTILQEYGIIENWLGSEEELAHFMNQITKGAGFWGGHYLEELYTEVNRYIGSNWNRQRAKLIRDYFSSPWAAISLSAALILLILTCVQSFYAVYTYYVPSSS